jgi:hypothetical protein
MTIGNRDWGRGRCLAIVCLICLIPAQKVFDTKSARIQILNFRNFPIGLVIILDRDSKTIFVRSRGGVLLQG